MKKASSRLLMFPCDICHYFIMMDNTLLNPCSLSDLKLKVFELSIHQIAGQKLSRNGIITSQ